MPNLPTPRRALLDSAKRFLAQQAEERLLNTNVTDPPRLTLKALEATAMSRSREKILSNLDDMYREAFERAKVTGDQTRPLTTTRETGALCARVEAPALTSAIARRS